MVNFKYASPEVDVWAAAACLYNMLTGATPRDFPRRQGCLASCFGIGTSAHPKAGLIIPPRLAEVIDKALIDRLLSFQDRR